MFPPLISTLLAAPAVLAVFGAPLRVFPFGAATAKGEPGYQIPYCVFQTVFGSPENYLGNVPDMDGWGVQLDTYAATLTAARNAARVLRDALDPVAYVTAWNGEFWDEATELFRYSMTVSFQTPR